MSLAIYYAREARAHNYQDPDLSPEYRPALKRLWWSCILRDRILSLALRRSPLIIPHDFDFSLPPLTAEDFSNDQGRSDVYGTRTQKALARIIELQCKLAVVLTDLLTLMFPRRMLFVPESRADSRQSLVQFDKCAALFDRWYDESWPHLVNLIQFEDALHSTRRYISITSIYYQ
jgi:hypothetical protein